MSGLQFHSVVLAVIGVAGILWFQGARRLPLSWSPLRRTFLGVVSGLVYLAPVLSAFANLSSASSLELFGFIGGLLGCLGAVRMLADATDPIHRGANAG